MRKGETAIPKLLKKAGYATAMAGKWHCNSMFNSNDQPQPGDMGFDHWLATQNNAAPSHETPTNYVRNGKAVGQIAGYSCQIVVDEGIRWLKDHTRQNADQPFFLYMAFHEPHEPVASPADLVEGYIEIAENKKEATYFANVENVDKAVGRFMAGLKELSLDENTLVVFTADNGPETLNRYPGAGHSYGSADPLRGMKLWTTDAGFRVAAIMRWPTGFSGRQTVIQPVSALDFLPTFCALAGVEPPTTLQLDGANFLPALTNGKIKREKPLIWVYYNALNEHRVAMRDGKWKVLAKLDLKKKYQNLCDQNIAEIKAARFVEFEVYNVAADIGERNNLIASKPTRKARLRKKLETHYKQLLNDSFIWAVDPRSSQ